MPNNPYQALELGLSASVGTTAQQVNVPSRVNDASGNSPVDGSGFQKANACRIVNTHATNLLKCRWDATATGSVFDFVVDGNQEIITKIPEGAEYLSVIASATSTAATVEFGTQ